MIVGEVSLTFGAYTLCTSHRSCTCTCMVTSNLPSPLPLSTSSLPHPPMQTGSELVQSGHYRSADIQRQMEEVSEAWEQLTEATTEKGRKLKDANELQVMCALVLACACACVCACLSVWWRAD